MINIIDKKNCCGCQACANICPESCITMRQDDEGFFYPIADSSKCLNCGLCEKCCPFLKREPLRINKPIAFASKVKNEKLREQSSSGGLFSELAIKIIEEGGVVYGVAFSNDFKSANHIRIDNVDDLYRFRGSKYFQAITGTIFQKVKEDLQRGTRVLFSGVPCQINGLKMFLRKDYDNLITVEVICHGVPSQALWNKYASYLEEKYNAKIDNVNFRNKKYGWKKFGLYIEGKRVRQYFDLTKDPYMSMFLNNFSLRPSCYDCNAKKIESMSDITLGDFWGIENVIPEMDDDKGTSLVLIQTAKGRKLIDSIDSLIIKKPVEFENAIKCNLSYCKSVLKPIERDSFYLDMNFMTFPKLEKKYCSTTILVKIKRKIHNSFIWKCIKCIMKRGGGQNSKFSYGLLIEFTKK